jgi:predicted transcriptional regulator
LIIYEILRSVVIMTRPKNPERLLTEVELELMNIVWELGGGTVADVQGRLPAERPLAYTSVATMLRILEQKGVLGSRKEGRGHFYRPLVDRAAYQAFTLEQMVDKVFGGQPLALARSLIDGGVLSRKDLASLKALLGKEAK